MPQMANITVKKADGTTDITYNALVASSGDRNPAVFRVEAASVFPARRPRATIATQDNGPKTARQVRFATSYPVYDANGVLLGNVPGQTMFTVPENLSVSDVAEAVHQHTNLCVTTLIRDSIKSGFAPT